MRLTHSELEVLCQIAVSAGKEIMDVYNNGGEAWQKSDDTPLTEADLRADAIIRRELEHHFPDIFILSEESSSSEQKTHDCFFLVDPLDGTKEFLKRNGEFTVNIALIDRGRPVGGVVYAPALNELFFGAHHIGAWKRDSHKNQAIKTVSSVDHNPLRIMGSRSHGTEKLGLWLNQITRPYIFMEAGSSLKFCRVAEGQADLYPRFGPTSQWDTAAAQAVLEAAGGIVTDLQGQTLSYGLDRAILNPEFFALGQSSLLNLIKKTS